MQSLPKSKSLTWRSISVLIVSLVLFVFAGPLVRLFCLSIVLNFSISASILNTILLAEVPLRIAMYIVFGGLFAYTVVMHRKVVGKSLVKPLLTAATVLLILFMFSSMFSAPLVKAETTAITGYYLARPIPGADWYLGKLSSGAYYAINGSNWNDLTAVEPWQSSPAWASYASNYTALTQQALASVTYGMVYLKEVPFNYNLTIPANVQVVENVNGLTRTFIASTSSQGSPYTISVDKVNTQYYLAQDSALRIINTWSSTNPSTVFNSAFGALPVGRNWQAKVVAQGNFTIPDTSINIPANCYFDAKNAFFWTNSESRATSLFVLSDCQNVVLDGIRVNGLKSSGPWVYEPTAFQITLTGYFSDFKSIQLYDWAGSGMNITATSYQNFNAENLDIDNNVLDIALNMTGVTDARLVNCGFNSYRTSDLRTFNCVDVDFQVCYFGGGTSPTHVNVDVDACRDMHFIGGTADSGQAGAFYFHNSGGGQNNRENTVANVRITKPFSQANNTYSTIKISDGTYNSISDCTFYKVTTENIAKYIFEETGTSDYNSFMHNSVAVDAVGTALTSIVGTHTIVTGTVGASQTMLFGYMNIGTLDQDSFSQSWAQTITVPVTTNLTSISFYCEAQTTANIQFAVYTDNAGQPSLNIYNSSIVAAPTGSYAWKTVSFVTPLTLSAGTYHIAETQDARVLWKYIATGANYYSTGAPTFTSTWTVNHSGTETVSLYATGVILNS